MADIDVVIKIPENEYKALSEMSEKEKVNELSYYEKIIANGTSLSKGYGRLIILSENKLKENQINLDFSCTKWISDVGLSNATVAIVETDKEKKE